MLTQKRKIKISRKNPKDEKEKARQREIADFISRKGVTRVEGNRKALSTLKDTHARCQLCDSWTDDSGELHHYDWCPTYKKSRKNPISIRKSNKYSYLIQVNREKTSRNHIFLKYQDKEIEFTGKDAEDLRDILKYQLSLFRGSSKLQKLYPEYLDNAGGFDTYITEQLREVYPKVFK